MVSDTGEVDVETVGPSSQGEPDHRSKRPHCKHHACCQYTQLRIHDFTFPVSSNNS